MILDERTEFADATSVAASAGTALIGDVYDLGSTKNHPGNSEGLYLVIQTDTSIITGGSAGTVQFFLVSDALATLGSATVASCTQHWASTAYATGGSATGDIAAGGQICAIELPRGNYERYLGILCTTGTTTTTAGKINAFLTTDPKAWTALPDAI